MKQWPIVGVLILTLAWGCAVSPYRQAELYIAGEEYQEALKIYLESLNPHVSNGRRMIYYDPEAITGVGVVFWHRKNYETASKVLRMVTTKTPTYGKALFYLGGCYEMMQQVDKAMNVYRQYAGVPEDDSFRESLKWRLDWLVRQKIAYEVRSAIDHENQLSVSSIPNNTIAVFYFYNLTDNPRWTPLQKGLAEMMITDFAQVDQLKVVERLRLQKLIEEMNLSQTGLTDESKSPQFGKLLGARNLVKGSYMILPDMKLELNAGFVNILQSSYPQLDNFEGTMPQLFTLEKQIVLGVLDDMNINLSPEQRNRILKVPTKNMKAFLNYCYGLDAMDLGDFDLAQHYFSSAVKLDPGFSWANDRLGSAAIYQATQISDAVQMSNSVTLAMGAAPGTGRGRQPGAASILTGISTMDRLQEMGEYMDAGFIPSNDTRESFNEYEESEAFSASGLGELPGLPPYPADVTLPEPPTPPTSNF